jgi:uncharacterized protein YjaZ
MRSILAVLLALTVFGTGSAHAVQTQILTDDVQRFFKLYDATRGQPSAAELQRDYIDAGSNGLREFIPYRIISAADLAKEIANHRGVYDKARKCANELPNVTPRLDAAFLKLATLLPDAKFPPVIVVVGRNNSGGTASRAGVLIGLEAVCSEDWLPSNLEDRLVHVIVHEYGHVQQAAGSQDGNQGPTVLRAALTEGGAELIAELASGQIANPQLLVWTKGHEAAIDRRFLRDADSTDLRPWLFAGPGTPAKPGDLGYWVGYRICKAYYESHGRTPAALRHILDIADPHEILDTSGWRPGMRLPTT